MTKKHRKSQNKQSAIAPNSPEIDRAIALSQPIAPVHSFSMN
jgi:hypothetical protein